jgi:hypothetical protein
VIARPDPVWLGSAWLAADDAPATAGASDADG